ncbi:hypothetical protein NPIL_352771 [Nephila pilipes]|uniref:Uncharacterized protein n=1 Tax=Nephila pilipes TaxID=299642 RepID=A0A8X6MNJ6_NEPPI|nr:hypothetical protein NPIL_352771 [Nephila pilipes]
MDKIVLLQKAFCTILASNQALHFFSTTQRMPYTKLRRFYVAHASSRWHISRLAVPSKGLLYSAGAAACRRLRGRPAALPKRKPHGYRAAPARWQKAWRGDTEAAA